MQLPPRSPSELSEPNELSEDPGGSAIHSVFLLLAARHRAGFLFARDRTKGARQIMNDFSRVVITTDGGSVCAHSDVDDAVEQTGRVLLVDLWYFFDRYHRGGGRVDAEMERIAHDAKNQAEFWWMQVGQALAKEKE